MADALRLELCGTGVNLTVAFPPNTDTPGFEEENKGKPEITKIMEDEVRERVVDALDKNRFHNPETESFSLNHHFRPFSNPPPPFLGTIVSPLPPRPVFTQPPPSLPRW